MKVYNFLFYTIYCLFEKAEIPWWSDFRAGFLIAAIEGLLLALVNFKISKYLGFGDATELGKWGYIVVIGAPVMLFNYFYFQYNDKWKEIIDYFDKAEKEEKRKRGLEMSIVLLFIGGLSIGLLFL